VSREHGDKFPWDDKEEERLIGEVKSGSIKPFIAVDRVGKIGGMFIGL
jgi:hypothetical protein